MASSRLAVAFGYLKTSVLFVSAASAWLVSTAKFWLNSDAPKTAFYLILYISDRFWVEVLVLAMLLTIALLPEATLRRARIRSEARVQEAISDIAMAIRPVRTTGAVMRTLGRLMLAGALAYLINDLAKPLTGLAYRRVVLAEKYSKADLLNYLTQYSLDQVDRLHYAAARSAYQSALELYGKSERTTEVQAELSKLDRFMEFGHATAARADELQQQNGFNRMSLYLYVLALTMIPDSEDVLQKVQHYAVHMQQLPAARDAVETRCRGGGTPSARPIISIEMFNSVSGFVSSRAAREILKQTVGGADIQAVGSLCALRSAFGPVIYEMTTERAQLDDLLRSFAEIRKNGIREKQLTGNEASSE